MSIFVKICGITSIDDARRVLAAGADWIGLNLVAGPRRIELAQAVNVVHELALVPHPKGDDLRVREPLGHAAAPVVALVNVDSYTFGDTMRALDSAEVRRFQLYGLVQSDHYRRMGERQLAAIHVCRVADARSLDELDRFLLDCGECPPAFVLFDSAPEADSRGLSGGTGRRANWDAIEQARSEGRFARWPPVILAGGLTPENVAEGVRRLRPFAVDVSSGVESGPGIKNPAKVRAFVAGARRP